ncbi:MAG: four-carbon acid sugar kinase family protein, partial [Sphaerochaetaceae bacterium]|nr:four-carbon acid sugar kinase family protein [Sphaerochaetaceae bacterium]
KGYLFVHNELLSESGMRYHPITPMLDSKVSRLMKAQSKGEPYEIFLDDVEKGPDYIASTIRSAESEGYRYIVIDSVNQENLNSIAVAVRNMRLLTGGSGLAIGLAKQISKESDDRDYFDILPQRGKSVIIAGSCSVKTNRQVDIYKKVAPSFPFDIDAYVTDPDLYLEKVVDLVCSNTSGKFAPLIYATKPPQMIQQLKTKYPNIDIGIEIEKFFGVLAKRLYGEGIRNFICAGGETSGVIAQSLGIEMFKIGPQVDPAVPWVKAIGDDIFLALKSGNFGSDDFFRKAQEFFV